MDARDTGRDRRRAVRTFGISVVVVLAAGSVLASGPGGGRGGYGYGYGYGGYNETPTPTPTPTPSPTATPTVTPPPPDKTPPVCATRPVRKQTARSIRSRGLKLKVRCDEAARHVTQVFVSRKQARKLGIKRDARKRVRVGRRTTLVRASVTQKVTVKLNRKARRGIRRMKQRGVRRLRLTIVATARDAANNVRRTSITRSFKR